MDDQVRKYNNKIRELLTVLEADLPKASSMDVIQRKFRLAISIDRTCIIEETTPELLQYRDYIAEDRIDELISKDWDAEIAKKALPAESLDKNSIMDMIRLLRDLWSGYDDEQKAFVRKTLKRLLNYCIKYHKAKQENKQ